MTIIQELITTMNDFVGNVRQQVSYYFPPTCMFPFARIVPRRFHNVSKRLPRVFTDHTLSFCFKKAGVTKTSGTHQSPWRVVKNWRGCLRPHI